MPAMLTRRCCEYHAFMQCGAAAVWQMMATMSAMSMYAAMLSSHLITRQLLQTLAYSIAAQSHTAKVGEAEPGLSACKGVGLWLAFFHCCHSTTITGALPLGHP